MTSSAVADARDPAGKALSLLSDRPQSQSLPLSGAEVYTHGKLIPVPCRLHIVLMSKVVCCVETGGDIFERQTHCGKPLHLETTHIGEAGGERRALMKGESLRKGERTRIKQAG